MSRPPIPGARERYEELLPALRAAARTHGYAIGVHGSMTYDLDLIAAPWTDDAGSAEDLVAAIMGAAAGFMVERADGAPKVTLKPHGRRAWTIYLIRRYGVDGVLDLSVLPKGDPA